MDTYFPIWKKLTVSEQNALKKSAKKETIKKGTVLQAGQSSCYGLLLVTSGQLRAFTTNFEREITLFRLLPHDFCLFSASCILNSLQFDLLLEAVTDTEVIIIAPDVYKELMDTSITIANFTNEIMASRFSEVMWLFEQVMFHNLDKRLAAFLLEEQALSQNDTLQITHEQIANHLGSAREVVTRMLKHFQKENLVTLSRGTVEISDTEKLTALAD